jgi:hypothetical protein
MLRATGRFGTDARGYRLLVAYARQWPDRVWAVEGANGIGRPLAQRLPDGTCLFELGRYRRRLFGHLHQGLVVLSAQVRADRRIDNRRHDRQRAEDDHADGDRDPGAQAHCSSRST